MTTAKLIKKYAMRAEPATNQWWLTLELEDGSNPDPIRLSSATELAAMLGILRHSRAAMFDPENNAIEIDYVPPGESAGGLWCKLYPWVDRTHNPTKAMSHAASTASHTCATPIPSWLMLEVSNCPFLIFCTNSIPLIVTAAFPNRLNPSIG